MVSRIQLPDNGSCILYCALFPNGKRYFGITQKTLEERKYRHLLDTRRGSSLVFHKALRKYGEQVKWSVIHTGLSRERAKEVEVRFISLFESTCKLNGYNITKGGDYTFKDVKPFKVYTVAGKFLGEWDSIAKAAKELNLEGSLISRCLSGKTTTHKGHIFTRDTFEKVSNSGRVRRDKAFDVFTLEGNFVGTWTNTKKCCEELNLGKPSEVRAVLTRTRTRKTYKNLIFKFKG